LIGTVAGDLWIIVFQERDSVRVQIEDEANIDNAFALIKSPG
jgi:hypothetical protein